MSMLFATNHTGYCQSVPQSHVFVDGEELTYNVRYYNFDLGQVRIKTLKRIENGKSVSYQTIAYIDSYKKVPLANLHAVFESLIDTAVYSQSFSGKALDGDSWAFGRYKFDYSAKRVFMESGRRDTIVHRRDTLVLDSKMQDGLSLFFYARDRLFSGKRENIPAVVQEKKVNTYINFSGKRKSVELDFVEYPVDVVGFDGTMEFTGIFGLTGDFEGWFSNDDARVPIVAQMKVILGSVTIELMQWNRPGWKPPKGIE
ncbi:MAG: DUF3108 domain-containing protein [bacterium]